MEIPQYNLGYSPSERLEPVDTMRSQLMIPWNPSEQYGIKGNRSKASDKKPRGQKPLDNKTPKIIEEIIAKYAVDANLFPLGTTNPFMMFLVKHLS